MGHTVTNKRTAVLVLSLLIGSIAAFFTYMYVNSAESRAYNGAKLVQVFVVKSDIAKDTGGDEALANGAIRADSVPAKFRPASALTDKNVVKGKVALTKLSAGQVLVDGMFVDPRIAQVTAAKRIPAGQVAMSIAIDAVHGVAGLVVPGDHVNIMSHDKDGNQRTLFENVEVLYIGATAAPEAGSTQAVQTPTSNLVTFAVPQIAAQRIVTAWQNRAPDGSPDVFLTLVPPDNQPTPIPPINTGNLFSGGVTPYAS
jgi:pilus assembly protein CpaB